MAQNKRHYHQPGDGSWWLEDCQGIPLARVCADCIDEVKSRYNPWVFTGYDQAFLDEYSGEQLDPDY